VHKQLGDVVDVKVHIKGTYITVVHVSIPIDLSDIVIIGLISSLVKMIEKGIIKGRRHIISELP